MSNNLTNGVEITRVNATSQNTGYGINPNLAVGSQRPHASKTTDLNTGGASAANATTVTEFGGNILHYIN